MQSALSNKYKHKDSFLLCLETRRSFLFKVRVNSLILLSLLEYFSIHLVSVKVSEPYKDKLDLYLKNKYENHRKEKPLSCQQFELACPST